MSPFVSFTVFLLCSFTLVNSKGTFRHVNTIYAELGCAAMMPCAIDNRTPEEVIMWQRLDDKEPLTVGRDIYKADPRLVLRYSSNDITDTYTIRINDVTMDDAGVYVCKVFEGNAQQYFTLEVEDFDK